MSGPKQFVEIGGMQIPTEEFVKNREAILARRSQQEEKPEAGQMMKKDRQFEEILKEVEKKEEGSGETHEETPVPFVEIGPESDVESDDLTQVPLEEEKPSKTKKKAVWKKK